MSLQGPLGLKSISVHTTLYYLSLAVQTLEKYMCVHCSVFSVYNTYTQSFVNTENYLSVIALGKVYDFINPLADDFHLV